MIRNLEYTHEKLTTNQISLVHLILSTRITKAHQIEGERSQGNWWNLFTSYFGFLLQLYSLLLIFFKLVMQALLTFASCFKFLEHYTTPWIPFHGTKYHMNIILLKSGFPFFLGGGILKLCTIIFLINSNEISQYFNRDFCLWKEIITQLLSKVILVLIPPTSFFLPFFFLSFLISSFNLVFL